MGVVVRIRGGSRARRTWSLHHAVVVAAIGLCPVRWCMTFPLVDGPCAVRAVALVSDQSDAEAGDPTKGYGMQGGHRGCGGLTRG